MSTRGIVKLRNEENETVAKIYVHFDTYPCGLGRYIADYPGDKTTLNFVSYLSKWSDRIYFLKPETKNEVVSETEWDIEYIYILEPYQVWVFERQNFGEKPVRIFTGSYFDFGKFIEAAEQTKKAAAA